MFTQSPRNTRLNNKRSIHAQSPSPPNKDLQDWRLSSPKAPVPGYGSNLDNRVEPEDRSAGIGIEERAMPEMSQE